MDRTVSVIIPVYNGERFIAAAINSALNQTLPPHEVIVVDDGSSDDTPRILESFGDRITIIRIMRSGGCAIPRNIGMDAAEGEYFAFLDADDTWAASKLERQVEVMERFPNIRLVCTDFFTTQPGKGLFRQFDLERFGNELWEGTIIYDSPFEAFPLLINRNFVGCPSSVMIESSLYRETGYFRAQYNSAEDFEYWLRCSLKTKFYIISQPLAYKRTHSGNVTANQMRVLSTHRNILIEARRNYRRLLARDGLDRICRGTLARLNFALARASGLEKWRDTTQYILDSLSWDPSVIPAEIFSRMLDRR